MSLNIQFNIWNYFLLAFQALNKIKWSFPFLTDFKSLLVPVFKNKYKNEKTFLMHLKN